MSKILYPVGTEVTLRKFPDAGVFEVTEYKKGEKYPYRIENDEGDTGVEGKTKFSVKGLKRYNPTQAKATQTGSDVASPKVRTATEVAQSIATPQKDTYSREEVDVLMAQQYEDLLSLVATVDKVAYEAFQKANRIAQVVDTNFCRVSKQFKTLNHDDD